MLANAEPTPSIHSSYKSGYTRPRKGRRPAHRFFVACLAALGLFGLGTIGVHLVNRDQQFFDDTSYPVPPNVELSHCVTDEDWTSNGNYPAFETFPHYSEANFDLQLPSEKLLLISKGAFSAGNLRISTSQEDTDEVHVQVTVHYYDKAIRDLAKICLIESGDGENGVGIFTPRMWRRRSHRERLYFDVELILPKATSSSPLHIKNLVTDVSNFSQDVNALKDIVDFETISLTGSNGHIYVESLAAQDATLSTSNARITSGLVFAPTAVIRSSNGVIFGSFNSSDSLEIHTSNARVEVNVGLHNEDNAAATLLDIRTSNGVIDSTFDLTTSSGSGGHFRIDSRTSNARLQAKVASSPLDSVLYLKTQTSNAAAAVTLHETYEGSFSLSTSRIAPTIKRVDSGQKDPAGKGRSRKIEGETASRGQATGKIYWDKENRNRGEVIVRTSNGPVILYV